MAVALAAKPAILIASLGIALGVLGFVLYRAAHRGDKAEDLLPRIDVAAYNDADLMAP